MGLHVYGSDNNITQAADLLANGAYALGIRVDGRGNTITVALGTRVQADGLGGTALLVSYGRDQVVNLAGEASAQGQGGIAARFDFGDNEMSNEVEYRGSWIRSVGGNPGDDTADLPSELEGPLLNSFNVTGRLAGSRAAIYIAENALVEEINIMNGARIDGDIISDWDPADTRIQAPSGTELHTALNFGLQPNSDGTASANPDHAFELTLNGGIDGAESLKMKLAGGQLAVTEPVAVYSLENSGYLSLYGLSNDEPGATVTTAFINQPGATLETGFNAAGQVAAVAAASATVGGDLVLSPLPDFYPSDADITAEAPVTAGGAAVTDFSSLALKNSSPTLDFVLLNDNQASPRIGSARAADAYSQYAASPAAAGLGLALVSVAAEAQGDMRHLLTALDFSAQDGREVRRGLSLLGPEAYDSAARASLARQGTLNGLMSRRLLAYTENYQAMEHWRLWATPYAAFSWHRAQGHISGYDSASSGLITGLDKSFGQGLTLGFHLALNAERSQIHSLARAEADSKAAYLGFQGLWAPADLDGLYVLAQGRLGLEETEMERFVSINGYSRRGANRHSSFTGGALAGLGKDWSVNGGGEAEIKAGPIGWLEYAFLRRPSLEESGALAANLALASTFYDSLRLGLGGRLVWEQSLAEGNNLKLDFLAAWRHELLDSPFSTEAAFLDYRGHGFSSSSKIVEKDSLLLQGALGVTQNELFAARLELTGEFFGSTGTALSVGLNLGWSF